MNQIARSRPAHPPHRGGPHNAPSRPAPPRPQGWLALAALLVGGLAASSSAQPEPYLRVNERDDGNIVELDVAVRAFEPSDGIGPRILLVGAAHIGDTGFYRRLQYLLDAQDLVLFEGVGLGDPDAPLPEIDQAVLDNRTEHRARLIAAAAVGHKSRHGQYPRSLDDLFGAMDDGTAAMLRPLAHDAAGQPMHYAPTTSPDARTGQPDVVSFTLSAGLGHGTLELEPSDLLAPRAAGGLEGAAGEDGIQRILARTLGVRFQLDAMDYTQPHWLNCDVSMEQFESLLNDAGLTSEGDSFLQMMTGGGLMGALQGPILGMLSGNTSLRELVKLILIDTLGQAEALMGNMPGPMGDLMDVLLHDRNDVVVERLHDVINQADGYESIGVFYGAAHLTGIEQALVQDLGYQPVATHWITAMGVDIERSGINPAEARTMRAMISNMMEQELRRLGGEAPAPPAGARDKPAR